MLNINKIVIITGPTASGKSDISLRVADTLSDIEIVSADSMQIYKYMNIGTDKPGNNILKKHKHHCINLVEPSEDYNVSCYVEQATKSIANILKRNKKPLIVGGTGLYLKALIQPIFQGPGRNKKIRDNLIKLAEEKGNTFLYEELKRYDSDYAQKISANDIKRIIRALEVYSITGKPISYHHGQKNEYSDKLNYEYCLICLNRRKEILHKRIGQRVEEMVERGLVEEVSELWERYNRINLNAFLAIGYKQIIDYLQGNTSREEAIEKIKKDTRHLAKRQLTWFRNQLEVDHWLDCDEYNNIEECTEEIVSIMRREGY
ncbi:MAG: tRNA (adenosine(37)-N6)-dimethylallyltransferase MiaA [Candidatus Atribacteria bacterium]|jgi:tRNA dimethylallyltransferase|nr:tRNA (adenosine(37)-N6)-dimethylallyltransferase MiaA [Candidatus Atribacteria bacterium]